METTAPTQVIEVVEQIDYTQNIEALAELLNTNAEYLGLISGFLLFFVVIALCYFVYKFFRIFF